VLERAILAKERKREEVSRVQGVAGLLDIAFALVGSASKVGSSSRKAKLLFTAERLYIIVQGLQASALD
jgi:hypothetical protein